MVYPNISQKSRVSTTDTHGKMGIVSHSRIAVLSDMFKYLAQVNPRLNKPSFTYLFVCKANAISGNLYFRAMTNFIYEGRQYYNPIELTMAFIGGTWKMPILLALRKGPVRYGDLKNTIPHITDKMLYSQLRDLEKKGMIARKAYKTKPPRVDYMLTDLGKKSIKVIDKINDFGDYLLEVEGVKRT
jgi:DNA-binding HxlR family transcriptional regulator